MVKIIKKAKSKWFLLFLLGLMSVGVQGQFDEYGAYGDIEDYNDGFVNGYYTGGTYVDGVNEYGVKRTFLRNGENTGYTDGNGDLVIVTHKIYTYTFPDTSFRYNPYANYDDYSGATGGAVGPRPPCPLTAAVCYPRVVVNCACVEKAVEKPCQGDPVISPEIAPQKNSGINGGRFGKTRSGGTQYHNGLDIKNAYGAPVYAMFDGTASLAGDANGKAGYISYQTANVNGTSISVQYFHMQNVGRVSGVVKAGDLIGYQGNSGNLAKAISSGSSDSHVHIKIKDSNGKTLNPEDYLATKFNSTTGKVTNVCK